jgi:alkanesulfonate monooxygenase
MPLKFHWRLPLGGLDASGMSAKVYAQEKIALPDLASQAEFCRGAEESGIDSLLTAFGSYMPDPVPLVTALAMTTEKIKFILAYRPGILSPTLFVQQVNTISALTGGRVSLNIVVGHSAEEQRYYGDFLNHDERYQRAEEFLSVCHSFWRRDGEVSFQGKYYRIDKGRLNTPFVSRERTTPEIYIGGGSPQARQLAVNQGSCWLLLADTPANLRPQIAPALLCGVEVGLRVSIIAAPTHEEAKCAAYSLADATHKKWIEEVFVRRSDSVSMKTSFELAGSADSHWLTPYLWNGAVPAFGASAVALVGTPREIADAIIEYKNIGFSQFIFSGWNNTQAPIYFSREILPLVRAKEREAGDGN